jgi:MerT mercuric transport protein
MKAQEVSAVGAATVGTGAVLTATVASACCAGPALAPIFVSVLGASGLAAVSGLRPYSPWLFLLSGAMLAFSFRQVFRKPACAADGTALPPSRGMRVARTTLWIAAALWFSSVAYAIYALHT